MLKKKHLAENFDFFLFNRKFRFIKCFSVSMPASLKEVLYLEKAASSSDFCLLHDYIN